jgi:hypothetical protein
LTLISKILVKLEVPEAHPNCFWQLHEELCKSIEDAEKHLDSKQTYLALGY